MGYTVCCMFIPMLFEHRQITVYTALTLYTEFLILISNILSWSTTLCPYEVLPGGFKAQDFLSFHEAYRVKQGARFSTERWDNFTTNQSTNQEISRLSRHHYVIWDLVKLFITW